MIKTCELCGQSFEPRDSYEARHQKYCSDDCRHLAHRKRVTLTCETCGKLFEVQSNAKGRRFCSPQCRADGLTDKTKRNGFVCDWCHGTFEDWAYRHPRFCSKQCRSEYASRCPRPTAQKPENRIMRICRHCGNEYQTTVFQVKYRGSNFCSPECQYAQMSLDRRGENNPHWTGGTLPASAYGPNWGSQQRKAKKRDKHTCQVCGYQAGGNRYLDVHHILPLKNFDGDTENANQLSNLICLCRTCHAQVECGNITVRADSAG